MSHFRALVRQVKGHPRYISRREKSRKHTANVICRLFPQQCVIAVKTSTLFVAAMCRYVAGDVVISPSNVLFGTYCESSDFLRH